MAQIEKRGKGYSVRYRYTDDRGVEHRPRISGFSTSEDAQAVAKELRRKSVMGIDVHGDDATCGEIMERWFSEHCSSLADTTKSRYSDGIDRLAGMFIYTVPVKRTSNKTYQALLSDLQKGVGGKREITLRTALSISEPLRLSLSWAANEGIIPSYPFESIALPKTRKKPQKILSDFDVKSLDEATRNHPFRIPLLLALYGGLRREEAAALTWYDVDQARRTVTINKAIARTSKGKEIEKDTKNTPSERTIILPKFVMDELKAAPKSSERVCVSSSGQPYKLDSYPQAVKRIIEGINAQRREANLKAMEDAKKAGKPRNSVRQLPPMPLATYHDLRHTHAAICIRLKMQPKVISERLGHASIKITMDLYGYLMPGLQESVADALDQEYGSSPEK
jgi:integrase